MGNYGCLRDGSKVTVSDGQGAQLSAGAGEQIGGKAIEHSRRRGYGASFITRQASGWH
jgi:hypothetical protein